jgi:phage terminase large subunit-like protein
MVGSAQRLIDAGVPMVECPQTLPNLTEASQLLFDLINSQSIVAYPNDGIRLAISRAVSKESSRGFHITKSTASHHIDVVIALMMACYAAVKDDQPVYLLDNMCDGPTNDRGHHKDIYFLDRVAGFKNMINNLALSEGGLWGVR